MLLSIYLLRILTLVVIRILVVLAETSMSDKVFRKFVNTRLKGTLINKLEKEKYLIEFPTDEGKTTSFYLL